MATHISNMLTAINAGTIPGAFEDDRKVFKFKTLAYAGSRGTTLYWTISVRLIHGSNIVPITPDMLDQPCPELKGYRAEITVEAKQEGGKVRDVVPTYVSAGKNIGKVNATNPITQAIRDALGLYNKKLKLGDTNIATANVDDTLANVDDTLADVAAVDNTPIPTTTTGFDLKPPPMLVKKLGDSREATLTPETFAEGVTVQRKLNGVHFVVFMDKEDPANPHLVRYSRTSTEFPGQNQVVAEMTTMMVTAPKITAGQFGTDAAAAVAYTTADPYFAGELYVHGRELPWINGQARRGDDEGILEFHIFDVFFPRAKALGFDMESRYRQQYIDAYFAAATSPHPHIVRVENFPAHNIEEVNALASRFLREGYEGAIARKDNAGYRYSYSGYHSGALMKIKPRPDAEFPVVGFTQGDRGKDVGAVIWVCKVPTPVDPMDATFTVVPNMTLEDRKSIYTCLSTMVVALDGKRMTRFDRDIKGLPLTVEFAEISTKTGKPLQAKAVAFRTYENGPDADPIRKMLLECTAKK